MGGSKPSVTLTFAGDSAKLEQTMAKVGDSSERMGRQVGDSSDRMRDAGSAADRMAEGTDTAEARSQGFADVITGATEGLAAWNDESLSTSEKLVAMGQAGADLAGGLTNFLIPAVAALATGLKTGLGSALNFIAAHPIVLVLIAIAALLVVLWMNSETFREIVTKAFNAVADFTTRVLGAAWNWLVDKFAAFVEFHRQALDRVRGFFAAAWDFVISKGSAFLNFYLSIPGRLLSAFMSLSQGLGNAFVSAFNRIARAWNSTVGSLSWTVPGWVPGLGGSSISAPRLPTFHTGGVVPGMPGQEVVALLRAGERVTPAGQGGSGGATLTFAGDTNSAMAAGIAYLVRTGALRLEVNGQAVRVA